MSMAEVIKSIEREALREAQSHEIGGRNGEPMFQVVEKVHGEENSSVASDIIEKLYCKEQLKNID